MKLTWIELSEEDKLAYKSYCESKYGESFTKLPSGEPVYLDGGLNLLNGISMPSHEQLGLQVDVYTKTN